MQAVINAGSEGTKLRPLTCTRSSAMLPILGKEAISYQLELLKTHGVTNVLVITGYLASSLEKFLGKGSKWGLEITCVEGSGGEANSLKELSHMLEEEFIYFSSTSITNVNLTAAVAFHREKESFATLIVPKGRGGRVTSDKSGRVTRFEEKKLWSLFKPGTAGGIYILRRDITRFIAGESTAELSETVLPALVRAGKSIYTYSSDAFFEEISDLSAFMRTNFSLLEKMCEEDRRAYVEPGAEVEPGALLEVPCYIAKGAKIKKGAKIGAYSVIGRGSVINEGASIKKSIIGKNCRIGGNAALRGCTTDDGATIGKNTSVYEQAVIGSKTKIGKECAVRSFIRIWPEKTVDDGKIVSENIMWGQKKRSRLFEEKVIEGIVNSDITPGFCLRLGECVGTVSDMGEIGVSSDGTPSAAMLRDALISGLLSTGAAVKDFGEQPLPITRRGVSFYMLSGGVSINVFDSGGEECAEITVIDKGGIDAGEKLRERLENLFEKGDFMRTDPKAIKEREYVFEYKLYYLKSLINSTKREKASLDILISCGASWGRRLLTSAANDFDCKVSIYSPALPDDGSGDAEFSAAVRKGGFDVGFIIDRCCETLKVVNCDGKVIGGSEYEALAALIVMKKYDRPKIYVPVTASEAIDTLGKKYNAEIVRTKVAPYEIMARLYGGEEYLSDQFILRFDAVGSVIKILDYFSSFNTNLTELLSLLPSINMTGTEISLSPSEIESAIERVKMINGAEKDNVEGVKITFDKGWVVVIPDSYKNVCKVVSEGATEEFARELCDFCVDEILK